MKRSFLFLTLGAVLASHAEPFEPPAGYYSSAEGLQGNALKDALHHIIDAHRVIDYSWPPFQAVDVSPTNSNEIELIYSPGTRGKFENGGSVGDWNREHLWPRSYGISSSGPDNSDIFNLRPSDVQVNAERGSLYFDDTNLSSQILLRYSAPGCSKDQDSWEPRADEIGDIARSCFYMAVRYDGSDSQTTDLELTDAPDRDQSRFGKLETLLDWHRADPVTERERERNQAIYDNWQRNRNPFIDRPEFAEQLFLENYPTRDADTDGLPDYWEWTSASSDEFDAMADPDGDGSPMLLEYAFAGNPIAKDSSPTILQNDGTLRFIYFRNITATGISYLIEYTTDLENGPWTSVSVINFSSEPAGANRNRIFAQIPDSTDQKRFYRMKITAN